MKDDDIKTHWQKESSGKNSSIVSISCIEFLLFQQCFRKDSTVVSIPCVEFNLLHGSHHVCFFGGKIAILGREQLHAVFTVHKFVVVCLSCFAVGVQEPKQREGKGYHNVVILQSI